MSYTDEIRLLINCSKTWSDDKDKSAIGELCAAGLDWNWIVRTATHNRVGPLVYTRLRETGLIRTIPPKASRSLETAYYQSLSQITLTQQTLEEALASLEEEGIQALLLRGLALGEAVYGDPALRPFSDSDLLIQKRDLNRTREILLSLDYKPYPPDIDPRYFERHHLHLQFLKENTVIELHWALDHKYTVFNIGYDAIFKGATRHKIAGANSLVMSPEDLLISLCIHLVKHCYYSKYTLAQSELVDLILDDGFLILYCDLNEVIHRYESRLDWDLLIHTARRWQVESAVRSALTLTVQLFKSPLPGSVPDALSQQHTSWIENKLARWTLTGIRRETSQDSSSQHLHNLFGFQSGFTFRPVRAMDFFQYLWPTTRFISERYGASNSVQVGFHRAVHSGKAIFEILANAVEFAYYSWIRRRR